MRHFLGIDVGTSSARAGLFDETGRLLAHAVRELQLWYPEADYVEQSTDDIWRCIGEATRAVMRETGLPADGVAGIGFDATCSLVVVEADGKPVTISPSGDPQRNVMVWMDHRAEAEAAAINTTGHPVLRNVGGRISPEMEVPKLLWLKKNLPDSWQRAGHFFDLPDYLTYRATGSLVRSQCSTVCKMTYQADESGAGWNAGFFKQIGLEELVEESFLRIGREIHPIGGMAGALTAHAAEELGLAPGIPVGISLIDAHAGGVGMLGADLQGEFRQQPGLTRRLALIGGTSSCHMAVSREARFIEGVWGPYYQAMVPGYWLTEGGQSATGALIDHIIENHAATAEVKAAAATEGVSIYQWLNHRLKELAGSQPIGRLTRDLHLWPDFHGNRSPLADPGSKGMIVGLTLDRSPDALALLYLAAIQGIAYGTRHILEAMSEAGYRIEVILVCGGGIKNPIFLQQHADITGLPLVIPREPEAVLLGSAMAAAVAAGIHATLPEAMATMSGAGRFLRPDRNEQDYHAVKYRVFHQMHACQQTIRQLSNPLQ